MNSKRSTTSMVIMVAMAVSLISITSIQQDVFAEGSGISMTATADSGSDTITVVGKTFSDISDVTFKVTSPDRNNVVTIEQVSPDNNGEFSVDFKVGPTWTEDGYYRITAKQGTGQNSFYTLNVFVEVVGGMTMQTMTNESNLESGIFAPVVNKDVMKRGLTLDPISIEPGSTTFTVTGVTDKMSQDVTLTVNAPNGNVVTVSQVPPISDGMFSADIIVGGSLWKQDGLYTVTATQSDDPIYSDVVQIDIKEGVVVPEFGTIAAMILVVAIISIIAVSARSRLSIIPRY